MDELARVREFRREVAPPSEEARRRAAARLGSAIDAEARLEAAVDGEATKLTNVGRWIAKRHMYPVVATLAAATAVALFLSTPWKDSPGFLERAEAALTPKGRILYMKTEFTSTSTDPACTVTYGPDEIWIDQTPPYRYRALTTSPDVPFSIVATARALACSKGRQIEIGGPLTGRGMLEFVPPNTLRIPDVRIGLPTPPDPVANLRAAIRTGRAHDEGKTTLHGRTVERIRIDPPRPPNCAIPCPRWPLYVYVDPDTFDLVETRGRDEIDLGSDPVVRVKLVTSYLRFEYLPRTVANLALTDIRAQHPDATGP